MAFNGYDPLDEASGDLSPLTPVLRQGLTAIAVLSCLSFVSSTAVLAYLTVKLARWHLRTWRQSRNAARGPATPTVDLALGLAEGLYMGEAAKQGRPPPRKKARPNQFVILLYNLLLADIHQAASFVLNAVWVGRDGIRVRTATCWAQAWLIQTGDLASSFFITAIAVHTYLAVVWKYTPPQSAVYTVVVFLWAFNYILIIIGIAVTDNGREAGGFFVRATAWCWINVRYEGLRLYIHYLWIFIALAQPPAAAGHDKAFLLYPLIYILCTAPLALGRIATMAGVDVPVWYFCTAGALITSNGWLDVLLWGVTRHRLLFGADVDAEESGLDTFAFMRTPHGRRWGNMACPEWLDGE
ncbi:putative G-protein coupled receptor protein [Chaetomium sp. MPI-CAGE-AT-0009]|nr:putative G-protein coupled receptor protein [Chaetomium sp. MPI-CAGE-AT-0009]